MTGCLALPFVVVGVVADGAMVARDWRMCGFERVDDVEGRKG